MRQRIIPGSASTIARRADAKFWEKPDAVFLGAKTGSPALNHAHMDVGLFGLSPSVSVWHMDFGDVRLYPARIQGRRLYGTVS